MGKCDEPRLPFPSLLAKCYGLQKQQNTKQKLPFTELSKKWFKKQTPSSRKHAEADSRLEHAKFFTSPTKVNKLFEEEVRNKKKVDNANVPFKSMSQKWYKRRGMLSLKNQSRKHSR